MRTLFLLILCVATLCAAEPPEGEAARYLEEAEWALKWDLFPEARSAAEAGWALGLTNHHMASTRMIVLARSGDEGRAREGLSIPPVPAPDPNRLVYLREAVGLAADYLRRDERAVLDRRVYEALCETLEIAGDVLGRYYHMAELRAGHEEALAEIRKGCRAILPIFVRHPEVAAQARQPANPEKPLIAKFRRRGFHIAFAHAAFFYEKPEDVLPFYREFLARNFVNDSVEIEQVFPTPSQLLKERWWRVYPLLAGWRPEDRIRVFEVEEAFAEELIQSPSGAANNCGRWLKGQYDARGDAPGRKKAVVELPKGPSEFQRPALEWVEPTREVIVQREEAKKAATAEELANAKRLEERRRDLEMIFNARTPEARKAAMEEAHRRRLARGDLMQGPPRAPVKAAPPAKREAPAKGAGPEVISAGVVASSNYWEIPFAKFREKARPGPASAPRMRNGKIWTQLRYEYFHYVARGEGRAGVISHAPAILEVDPEDWSWKLIPLDEVMPKQDEEVSALTYFLAENNFEVTREALWLMNSAGLHRLDLKSRRWTSKPLLGEAGDLYLIDGRLICSAESSIYEIKEEGERIELMASCRRRPAVSPMDELADFKRAPLAPADGGLMRAFFKEEAWLMAGAKSRAELHLTNANHWATERGAIYVQWKHPEVNGLVYWVDPAGAPQFIGSTRTMPTSATSAPPKWALHHHIVWNGGGTTFENSPAFMVPMQQELNSSWKVRSMLMAVMDASAPGPAPVGVELRMDFSTATESRAPFKSIFAPGPVLETEKDLMMIPFTAPGFIKFSKDEIRRAIASARKP